MSKALKLSGANILQRTLGCFLRTSLPLVVLLTGAFGQVPESVATIVKVDTSQGATNLTIQNTGVKPITAFIVRYTGSGPKHGFVVWQVNDAPITTNKSSSMQVWPGLDSGNLASQIALAAVIFSDRTYLGTAPNRANHGIDEVTSIFDRWRGMADAFAAWQSILAKLPTDDHGFVQAFIAKANSIQIPDAAVSDYQEGAMEIDGGMKATAERLVKSIEQGKTSAYAADAALVDSNLPDRGVHDEASGHRFVMSWVDTRTAQSRIQAINAGEASK